jgi:hypothetical protein
MLALWALAGCSLAPRLPSFLGGASSSGAAGTPAADAPSETEANPAPDVAARAPNDDPARLMGLDEVALRRLLGQPAFMRRDVPALLWRYAAADCTLDVFLYRKSATAPFTVTHVAARAQNGVRTLTAPAASTEINPRVCLGAVLRARPGASSPPTG